jgi:hypothetical protein
MAKGWFFTPKGKFNLTRHPVRRRRNMTTTVSQTREGRELIHAQATLYVGAFMAIAVLIWVRHRG